MLTIDPKEVSVPKMHGYLLGAVVPRPIAFASTVDKEGNINLSPFSFFNIFSANPPILVFSPSRRGRDNTTKHTYENVLEVPEVVINIVNYNIVQQASLSSTEYDKGVNEFIKSGLTPVASERIKPPRVGESPVSFECKVNEVISLGSNGGAGNLVICEVLLAHIKEEVLDEEGRIDPVKLDAVARMGGNYYCRAQGDAIFTVPKPLTTKGIGVDQIPMAIRNSKVLTGNDLGILGNVERLPAKGSLDEVIEYAGTNAVHTQAQKLLNEGKVESAWRLLLTYHG
ncbi:MAG TPA: flavin reductase family protein [Cyclobacteriaceae bacterium]|nr:flavin reductase family protein [Cyclobacteriaceae bacterium]